MLDVMTVVATSLSAARADRQLMLLSFLVLGVTLASIYSSKYYNKTKTESESESEEKSMTIQLPGTDMSLRMTLHKKMDDVKLSSCSQFNQRYSQRSSVTEFDSDDEFFVNNQESDYGHKKE
jgi:hypothetical protein